MAQDTKGSWTTRSNTDFGFCPLLLSPGGCAAIRCAWCVLFSVLTFELENTALLID